jgi:tetratricopeptide (TPR) repeat protein
MARTLLAMALAAAIFGGPAVGPVLAQGRQTPAASYYFALGAFYNGDYRDALRAFKAESRGSIKTSQSRWIDSICYETMCGECCFQMGVLDEALLHYTNALNLFKRFPDWMAKVRFSPTIRLAGTGARKAVPWGVTSRQSQLGFYPLNVNILQGQIEFSDLAERGGGVVQQANLYPVTPQEIVRCTTLALRRRAAILGPVSKHDPLTTDLIATTAGTLCPANHWSQSWADLERGLALLAGGKETQAISHLQRAVLAAGEFDHPMTCIALFELGRLAMLRGEYPAASKFFEEATYSAVNSYSLAPYLPDYGILEEAFRYGMVTHLMANQKGFFAPLEAALRWKDTHNLRQFHASLLLLAAENYAVLGKTSEAAAMLDEAKAAIGRRTMGAGWIGSRFNYLSALAAFQKKRLADSNASLAAAMDYMRHGSLWLFHVRLADELYAGGGVIPRVGLDLFGEVLRDPQPADWALDPMESLSVLMTPHPVPMEHWFEAALERKDVKAAIEIADRIRRHRFFTSLEFGGRLESLRWVLEAPTAYLPQQALLQRQDMLVRYPAYERLSQQSQAIRAALGKMPLVADDATASREQARQLGELAALGLKQEAILREIALRREPADMVFPPLRTVAEVQKSLPDKQTALVFLATSRHWYGFLLTNDRVTHWRINSPPTVLKQMQTMLREMGNYGQNHELALKDLTGAKWKQSAGQVLNHLEKGSLVDLSQPFDELVIVPDGVLWYLPFEALQVTVDGKPQSLLSRFRIRYAPTLSLCTWQGPGRSAAGNTAVVVGKLYPRDGDAVAQAAFEQLAAVVPGAVALRSPPPAPSSIYGTLFQRLIVLDDLALADRDPYGWAPAPIDRGKAGAALDDWLALPWGGPDVVVLPGFHTAAEDGLKRVSRNLPGNDVFLSVCGLMASGARTILLSRWRSGGQSSFDLVREFVQELPNTSPADAWQRAVMLVVDSRVNLAAEPRVKHVAAEETPKASSPFFWAGFMLVDGGTAPEKAEAKPEKKEAKPERKEAKPEKPGVKPEGPAVEPKNADKPADKIKPKKRRN